MCTGVLMQVPTRWTGSTQPYKTKYELYYEPYFLGPASMPRYDER